MRRFLISLIVVAAVVMGSALPVGAHGTKRPYCGIRWGSSPKISNVYTHTTSTVTGLRAGQHKCFDRLVVDLGPSALFESAELGYGYQARYGAALYGEPAEPLPIEGGAVLNVVVNAAAHDFDYQPTFTPADPFDAVDVGGFRTLRQVAFLGTFEGQTDIAIGVRARLPYRIFILQGPGTGSRLVIDIAHRW